MMLLNVGTLMNGRRGALGASSQTALQRILALSASGLWWPQQGSGWQGTSGGTLAASGQPVGLLPDLSQLGGKTLADWLATAPELVTNGGFDSDTAWTKGTGWTISGGTANFTATGSISNLSQAGSYVEGRVYEITVTATVVAGQLNCFIGSGGTGGINVFTASGTRSRIVRCAGGTPAVFLQATATFTGTVDNISIRELPGNHLRAGTWASPSDAARGTLQVSAGKSWIDPDATNDQYSFLSALSARAIVARVRVPAAYTSNDRFLTNDAESVNVSVNSGDWTNTGSGSTRINGASGTTFTADEWQTLTIEWGSSQTFSRMWYSATGTQFGSMDVAGLVVLDAPFASTADRAALESIVGTFA